MHLKKLHTLFTIKCLSLLSISSYGQVNDNLPYIGPRSSEHNCTGLMKIPDGLSAEIEFNYDCSTAYVKPPALSYEIAGLMFIHTYPCASFNLGKEYLEEARLIIDDLERKERAGTITQDELGVLERNIAHLPRLERRYEESLQRLNNIGARMNMYVSFKQWDEDIQKLREANPVANFDIQKQPINLSFLHFSSLEKVANNTNDSLEMYRVKNESVDSYNIIRNIVSPAPEFTSDLDEYLKNKFYIRPQVNQSMRLFGRSTNILLDISGYGACLLDRNGDLKFDEKDDDSANDSQITSLFTLGLSYYTPFRTGTIIEAKITNYDRIIEAIQNYKKSNTRARYNTLFNAIKNTLTNDVVQINVLSANTGVLITEGDVKPEMIQATIEELTTMLVSRVTNVTTSHLIGHTHSVEVNATRKVCRRRVLGQCVSKRDVHYTVELIETDYVSALNEIQSILDYESKQEKIFYIKDERFDTIHSSFIKN